MLEKINMMIDGQAVVSQSEHWLDVTNPATHDEIETAVTSAKKAFETWKDVPVPVRVRMVLQYQHLLKENHDAIAEALAEETGKTFEDC